MRASSSVAAILVSAFAFAAPALMSPVMAADLDGEGYAEPYDESGYANDAYAAPEQYRDERYGEARGPDDRYDPGEPLPGSIKDGYPVPMPPPRYTDDRRSEPPRYSEPPRIRERPVAHACLERWQIRRSLNRDGWADIRPMGGDGAIVRIRASRFDSGRVFNLRVDRCSGEILAARPHYLRSFAYRDRPWRGGY